MAGCRNDEERAVTDDVVRTREWPHSGAWEVDEDGQGGRPMLGDVAAQPPGEPRRTLPLDGRDDHVGVRKRSDAADMIGVQVGEHDPAHRAGVDTGPRELSADLVLRLELEARQPKVRMPNRVVP